MHVSPGNPQVGPADRGSAHRAGPGRRAAKDRGAAAVEMALVLPLLLMLMFGIIDFGRMLNKQISVTTAAQEGARVVALGGTVAERNERATAIAGDVAVSGSGCSAGGGGDADVTVTHTFEFVTPVGLIGGGFDGEVTLTGHGVMPCH